MWFCVRTQCLHKILFTFWCLGSEWRSKQILGKWFSIWISSCLNSFPWPLKIWLEVSHHVFCTLTASLFSVLSFLLQSASTWATLSAFTTKHCQLKCLCCFQHQTRGLGSTSIWSGTCAFIHPLQSLPWAPPGIYLLNTQSMLNFWTIILKLPWIREIKIMFRETC